MKVDMLYYVGDIKTNFERLQLHCLYFIDPKKAVLLCFTEQLDLLDMQ